MKRIKNHTKSQKGFTLIELSIVLVIIGLIVGGVLVGQDLIRAAEIRATVSQLEKYNSAVNTFRSKYSALPGDMPVTAAISFGLNSATAGVGGGSAMTGAAGLGDGNGLLEGGGPYTALTGEVLIFWNHLSQANLVDGSFGGLTSGNMAANAIVPTAAVTTSTLNAWVPPAKLGRGNYIFTYSALGTNYYEIIGATGLTLGTGAYALATDMTPIEARNIDAKLDDGQPTTGIIQATDNGTANTLNNVSAQGAGKCAASATAYSVGTTDGNSLLCGIKARFN
jgi:prepilin-type N-terminal cleavage/methylation domain-containing protein